METLNIIIIIGDSPEVKQSVAGGSITFGGIWIVYFLRYSELLYDFGPACEECWRRAKELAYEGTTQAHEN